MFNQLFFLSSLVHQKITLTLWGWYPNIFFKVFFVDLWTAIKLLLPEYPIASCAVDTALLLERTTYFTLPIALPSVYRTRHKVVYLVLCIFSVRKKAHPVLRAVFPFWSSTPTRLSGSRSTPATDYRRIPHSNCWQLVFGDLEARVKSEAKIKVDMLHTVVGRRVVCGRCGGSWVCSIASLFRRCQEVYVPNSSRIFTPGLAEWSARLHHQMRLFWAEKNTQG
jgi:hypothetical protein